MSKNEHPNAMFFSGSKTYENKKFDRANNVNSKRRLKRIEEVIFYFDKKKKEYADFIKDYKILKAPDKYRTLDKDSELVFRIRECELDYLQFDFNVLQKFIKIVNAFEIMKEDKAS